MKLELISIILKIIIVKYVLKTLDWIAKHKIYYRLILVIDKRRSGMIWHTETGIR